MRVIGVLAAAALGGSLLVAAPSPASAVSPNPGTWADAVGDAPKNIDITQVSLTRKGSKAVAQLQVAKLKTRGTFRLDLQWYESNTVVEVRRAHGHVRSTTTEHDQTGSRTRCHSKVAWRRKGSTLTVTVPRRCSSVSNWSNSDSSGPVLNVTAKLGRKNDVAGYDQWYAGWRAEHDQMKYAIQTADLVLAAASKRDLASLADPDLLFIDEAGRKRLVDWVGGENATATDCFFQTLDDVQVANCGIAFDGEYHYLYFLLYRDYTSTGWTVREFYIDDGF